MNTARQRYRPWFYLGAISLILSALLRVVIWGVFGRSESVPFSTLLKALPLGLLNDLIVLLYFLIIPTVLNLIIPNRWYASRAIRGSAYVLAFALIYGALYLAPAEFYFFEEFDARFNLVAVDYLFYPTEVLTNLWESYPIMWFVAGAFIVSALILAALSRRMFRGAFEAVPLRTRSQIALIHGVAIWACLSVFSTDTFALFQNRVGNEITANGISSFFCALFTNDLDYDLYYPMIEPARAYSVIRSELARGGGSFVSGDASNLNRRHEQKPGGLGKMNVVILSEESLGAQFIGALGDTRGLSPTIDKLSKQGLFFTRAYATGTRTVRGLEAISASFPPIPSESILKRPGQEPMASWGQAMQALGYATSFIYGGFAYFDNMRAFYEPKGFDIQDRFNVKNQTFANIWGVCDEDLFNHALGYFDSINASGKPFFSIIMTTSNHKPYTFPAGIPGVPERGGGRETGARYADYAIGKFLESARSKAWFSNTIFVIIADHDARVYGRAQIPMRHYEIPLLILAPDRITPRNVDVPTSQMDLMPTVLGLLGLPYTGPFYGQDTLSLAPGHDHPILINHNHNVALYSGSTVVILGLHQRVDTYSYNRDTDTFVPTAENPALTELATAYYQTGFDQYKRERYRLPQ